MCLSGWSTAEEPSESDWLKVIPERGWKKKRCWLAFLQRCGTESWTEVRCYFSMHCVLFPQCFFVWPTGSNKRWSSFKLLYKWLCFAVPPVSSSGLQNNQIKKWFVIQINRMCEAWRGLSVKRGELPLENTLCFQKLVQCLLQLNSYMLARIWHWCLTVHIILLAIPLHIYCFVAIIIAHVLQMHGPSWDPIKNLQSQGLVSVFYTDWHNVKIKKPN